LDGEKKGRKREWSGKRPGRFGNEVWPLEAERGENRTGRPGGDSPGRTGQKNGRAEIVASGKFECSSLRDLRDYVKSMTLTRQQSV